MICDSPPSRDASKHRIWGSSLKQYKRYAQDMIILETRSEVKVTVTQGWYVTHLHLKMQQNTKFVISYLK